MVSVSDERWPLAGSPTTIGSMAVHVDADLPIHPLTVIEVDAMVRAGILGEDDRVELLDGVLVEMSPQGEAHALAIRELMMLAFPAAAAQGLVVSVQAPLDVGDAVSRPEPDLAVVPRPPRDRHAQDALLVVEMGATSLAVDLGRKAVIYAQAGIPEYWVLDVERRELVVHLRPEASHYTIIRHHTSGQTVTAGALSLSFRVSQLL